MRKKILRIVSVFLLLNILVNVFVPAVSYALTAGPTAPEYTSFEPVDTTDMVNLATGDFTYNIPLIEVPGPEGGYPLSLSYHAGIGPDEEASWVGLGWTLNPGSLNRSVQGFPDDVYASPRTMHDYWPGGISNTFTVGIGYLMASVDVDIANDTYKGTGVGVSLSGGHRYELGNASLGIAGTISTGMYEEGPSAGLQGSAGIIFNDKTAYLGLSAGVSTNFNSISAHAGVGLGIGVLSVIGASISSNNLNPSLSYGGVSTSFISNNNAGKISTESGGFRATIPLPYGFSLTLGKQYNRYWSDQSDAMNMYGSLYTRNSTGNSVNSSMDSYIIPNSTSIDADAQSKYSGMAFPDYDMYSVLGQGIGGTISPYTFENTTLSNRNMVSSDGYSDVSYGSTEVFSQDYPINFRFKNDFSNKYLIAKGGYPIESDFENVILSLHPTTKEYDEDYYNSTQNKLAGSRNVEWVTNGDIHSGIFRSQTDFIPHEGANFGDRQTNLYGCDISKQIGGFIVTNTSGVSYHYSIPVYAYGEYSKITSGDGSYKETTNAQPYAYTWLLTGLTGPDYIDRGEFGFSDDDLGYWVKFDYGKWTDDFKFRTPFTGKNKDLDQGYEIYTSGKKELYYLNYIRTRTHTAIFEKDIRNDGKGVSDLASGGITPVKDNSANTLTFPVSPMKLSNVYLFENESLAKLLESDEGVTLNNLKEQGENKYTIGHFAGSIGPDPFTSTTPVNHFWDNVFDTYDIEEIHNFTNAALRKITFNTSYELCANTANSILDHDYYYDHYNPDNPNFTNPAPYRPALTVVNNGKLTLNSVEFKGRSGISIMPPTVFHYNYSNELGIYDNIANDLDNNPSYNEDKKDIWGNYKSDLDKAFLEKNGPYARSVSDESALSVDVWSLKEIETPIGATIRVDYETDTYENTIFGDINSLPITDIDIIDDYTLKISFDNTNNKFDLNTLLSDYIQSDKKLRIIGSFKYTSTAAVDGPYEERCISTQGVGMPGFTFWQNFDEEVKILNANDIQNDFIIVNKSYDESIAWDERAEFGNISIPKGTFDPVVVSCKCRFNGFGGNIDYSANSTEAGWGQYIFFPLGQLAGGGMFFEKSLTKKGGGLRVMKISVNDRQQIFSTNYEYEEGVTSLVPGGYTNNFKYQTDFNLNDKVLWVTQSESNGKIKSAIAKLIFSLTGQYDVLRYARELPGPGVMYGKVKVSESVQDFNVVSSLRVKPGYKEFNFRTFKYGGTTGDFETTGSSSTYSTNYREGIFKDFSSRIGNPISIIDYSASNVPIEETKYHYAYDQPNSINQLPNNSYVNLIDTKYEKQGHIEELFNQYVKIGISANPHVYLTYSKRIEYPSILEKISTKNYKTGVVTSSENLEFDFITGTPTKTLTSDAYGNRYIAETILAHTLDEYKDGMGIKIYNDYSTGSRLSKHMLSQVAGSVVYKVNNLNAPIGLVSSQVDTWKSDPYQNTFYGQSNIGAFQTTPVWRPFRSYNWIGTDQLLSDGTHDWISYSEDLFDAWNSFENPDADSYWQKISEITMYNENSKILEISDINNQFSSSRLDRKSRFIIANASPSMYNEMTYSGAEDYSGNNLLDNGVSRGDGIPSLSFAHTGSYSLQVDPNEKGFEYTLDGDELDNTKKYWASVWVYMPGVTENNLSDAGLYYKIDGSIVSESYPIITHKAGNKFLINLKITPNGVKDIVIGCRNNSSRAIYFDDFRVHPLGASMNSYVHNPTTNELIAILNNENLYTRYVYDDAGRLTKTFQEIFHTVEKKVSNTRYNYGKNY